MEKSKKLFVLKGEVNSYKTSVLKDLQKMLEMLYLGGKNARLGIIQCKNGEKIGIETSCEPPEHLRNSLDYFKRQNCDVIFCPCNTRGETIKIVDAMNDTYAIKPVDCEDIGLAERVDIDTKGLFSEQSHSLRIEARL